jgi:hypothetical protein
LTFEGHLLENLYSWNTLELNIRQSNSVKQFKDALILLSSYKPNKLYDCFSSESSIHHARMRMGLSGLNAHRKKYNFIQHNFCPLCGMKNEDPIHFLLLCPYQAAPRAVMMREISALF